MSNGQTPSPLGGDPSKMQSAMMPVLNLLRQQAIAAGEDPQVIDSMVPGNLSGTPPATAGPPPSIAFPGQGATGAPPMAPPVSTTTPLAPSPTPSPMSPSNAVPPVIDQVSAPPPIPRPRPAPGGPPPTGIPSPAGPQGAPGPTGAPQTPAMLPMHAGGTLTQPPQPSPLPGVAGPTGNQGAAGTGGMLRGKAALEMLQGQGLEDPNAPKAKSKGFLGGLLGGWGGGQAAEEPAEGTVEWETKKKQEAAKAALVKKEGHYLHTKMTPEKEAAYLKILEDRKSKAAEKKDIAKPSSTKEGTMNAWLGEAETYAAKVAGGGAGSFKKGDQEALSAFGKLAATGALGPTVSKNMLHEHNVAMEKIEQDTGKPATHTQRRNDLVRSLVKSLRANYNAHPEVHDGSHLREDANYTSEPLDRSLRQQKYADEIKRWASIMDWTGEGGNAEARANSLLSLLTMPKSVSSGGIEAIGDGSEADKRLIAGLKSMGTVAGATATPPEPGGLFRGIDKATSWGETDRQKIAGKPKAIREVIAGKFRRGEGSVEELIESTKWDNAEVLTNLLQSAGVRGGNAYQASIDLFKQAHPGVPVNLSHIAAAWEKAKPNEGHGKLFSQYLFGMNKSKALYDSDPSAGAPQGSEKVFNLNQQLQNLKRVYIEGKEPRPGMEIYSLEDSPLEPDTVEMGGNLYHVQDEAGMLDLPEALDEQNQPKYKDGKPLFGINVDPDTNERITSDDPRYDPSKAMPVMNERAAAATKKASTAQAAEAEKLQQATAATAKRTQTQETDRTIQQIHRFESEMGALYDKRKAGQGKMAMEGYGTMSQMAHETAKAQLQTEVDGSMEMLRDKEKLLEFGKMIASSLHKIGDSMTAISAGLRPGQIQQYVPTSINEALKATGAKKEDALMRLSVFTMSGHMFPKGTSAASMKAQMPLLQHSQNLQQKSEQFLSTMKQKDYQSWLDYRQNVLGLKIDADKERFVREKFERTFAHTREKDAKQFSLDKMKAQMAGGAKYGDGALSGVQLQTIQALKATLDMGREVLAEKPKFGTGWAHNWYESLGNYLGWANPEWHSFKQKVTTQLNTYVNNLTGKQLSKHEVSRLKGAVPQITDDDAVFTAKAKTFIKIQEMILARKLRTYAVAGMNMKGYFLDQELTWKVRGGTERTGTYAQMREFMRISPHTFGKIDIMTGPQGKAMRQGDEYLADLVGGFMVRDPNTGKLKYNEAEYGYVDPRTVSAAWGQGAQGALVRAGAGALYQ